MKIKDMIEYLKTLHQDYELKYTYEEYLDSPTYSIQKEFDEDNFEINNNYKSIEVYTNF